MIDNPSSLHPHETIDIPLDQIHKGAKIGDITAKSQRQGEFGIMASMEKTKLANFLNDSGKVDFEKLKGYAQDLPTPLNINEFLAQFSNIKGNKAIIQTPLKEIEINPKYAFYHLSKNHKLGNRKENRQYLSGGILQTLENPLFVTLDTKTQSYFYYKPFKNEKGLVNLVSVEVPINNNRLQYKTSYRGEGNKILKMIKEHKLLYLAGSS